MISFHVNNHSDARCVKCEEPLTLKAVGHYTEQKIKHLFHEGCLPVHCFCGHRFPPTPLPLLRIAANTLAGMTAAELTKRFDIEVEPTIGYAILIAVTASFTAVGSSCIMHSRMVQIPNIAFVGKGIAFLAISGADAFLPPNCHILRIAAAAALIGAVTLGLKTPLKKTIRVANSILGAAVDLAAAVGAYAVGKQIRSLPSALLGVGAAAAHSLTRITRERWDIDIIE